MQDPDGWPSIDCPNCGAAGDEPCKDWCSDVGVSPSREGEREGRPDARATQTPRWLQADRRNSQSIVVRFKRCPHCGDNLNADWPGFKPHVEACKRRHKIARAVDGTRKFERRIAWKK